MSDALVIALILALLVAVGAVVALARRKPMAPPPAVDEDSLRRLLDEAVSRSASEVKPAAEPDLGRFALLSHEAQAAAEAADAVRRTAAEAAEERDAYGGRHAPVLRGGRGRPGPRGRAPAGRRARDPWAAGSRHRAGRGP